MDFCIYDDIFDTILIIDKKVLHFKLSKSGQIVYVDKTGFPRPSHISISVQSYTIEGHKLHLAHTFLLLSSTTTK